MPGELIPVGTRVQVTPAGDEEPYRAHVRGYDMFRTKYPVQVDEWPGGLFRWPFLSEVTPIEAPNEATKEAQ